MIFLYPYFLLLAFVPLIFFVLLRRAEKNSSLSKICDPHLLPYLTIRVRGTGSFFSYFMIFCWLLGCICLSGPAIERKTQTAITADGLVVVVDMSPAMQGDTASQMARKLYDLSDYKKDSSIGLVLADSEAYIALPMTQDKTVLKNIIPDLKENIMPANGQNFKAGIDKANQLLEQSGFKKGQILLLTAGATNTSDLINAVKSSSYPVSVIGFGQVELKPVKLSDGQFWGKNTPFLLGLSGLQENLGRRYAKATLNETDLKSLLSSSNLENIEKSKDTIMQYQNIGVYGLLLLVPLVALLFRKGILFLFLFSVFPFPTQANLWLRTEQQIYQQQMQGISEFNLGEYEKAKKTFENISNTDIDALYNLGNTLAYMGQFDQAIKTYEKVLSSNPEHEDAQYNLEYLKKQLPPPPPQSSQSSSEQSDEKQEQQNQTEKNEASETQKEDNTSRQSDNQENTNQNKSQPQKRENSKSEDSHEEKNMENNSSEQQKTESTMVPDENVQDNEKTLNTPQQMTAQEQKEKEWMDKIKFDAGQVLRYRLRKQYQEEK